MREQSLFDIIYYKNKRGEKQVKEYIQELNNKIDKNSRIKFNKIVEYIRRLQQYGIKIGKPTIDKIEGSNLWELRPFKDRIFFAYWKEDTFILLHHFEKKTQKTPKREIEQAKHNFEDWKERFGE